MRLTDETAPTRRGLILVMCLLVPACSPSPDPDPDGGDTAAGDTAGDSTPDGTDGGDADAGSAATSLVSIDAWERVDSAADPLASHRPSEIECPESATEIEPLQGERTLSISTEQCNYFAARQQTLADIDSGDTLRVRVWHFELTHDQADEAHVALALDGQIVWEEFVALPTDAGGLLSAEWEASVDYAAGTRVDFHLHNHGANNWNVIEFSNAGQ